MINFSKFHKNITLISLFITLVCCQLKEPVKNHGILFLENRSNQLKISQSNKNDVIKLIGNPHTISFNNNNDWIYIERTLTKGSFHKLGQNVLKTNNVLVLNFDKYGILREKKLYDKNDKKLIKFSKNKTNNELTQKSFIEKFLSSIKAKMYSRNK